MIVSLVWLMSIYWLGKWILFYSTVIRVVFEMWFSYFFMQVINSSWKEKPVCSKFLRTCTVYLVEADLAYLRHVKGFSSLLRRERKSFFSRVDWGGKLEISAVPYPCGVSVRSVTCLWFQAWLHLCFRMIWPPCGTRWGVISPVHLLA